MSDDLTFQDTPLYAWLRANVWYLLGGLVLLLAILLYRENAPKWKQASFADSWDQHRALIGDPAGLETLATQLADAKKDERIFEWVVYNAARTAAESANAEALALLKPELEALAQTSEVMIAGPAGSERLAAVLLRNLYQGPGSLPKDPAAPEPDGGRIAITLSQGDTATYDIVVGLYEATAPNGTAALKQWVSEGRFAERTAKPTGSMSLNISLAPTEAGEDAGGDGEAAATPAAPGLMVERKHGYFHSEGTLAPGILPGKPGEQDVNNLQLALVNSYQMDGQTTVLGKVVEGWQAFKDAVNLAGPTAEFKVVAAKVLE
jgi:hypothetical protein